MEARVLQSTFYHLRTDMFALFGWWIATAIDSSRNYKHLPLRHGNSREFSYPCCPLQRIFHSSTVQTVLLLSDND